MRKANMLRNIEAFNLLFSVSQAAINSGLAIQVIAAPPDITPAHPKRKTMIESLQVVVVQKHFCVSDTAKKIMLMVLIFFFAFANATIKLY